MNLLKKHQVLVLSFVATLSTILWTCGCAGFAEPVSPLSITPTALSVSAKVGTASSQTVSVTNIGTADVSVSQAIINGAGFSVSGLTTPLSLAVGQTQSFTVQFDSATAATINGSLTIMTDARHRPVVLSLHGSAGSSNPPVESVSVSPTAATPAPDTKVLFTAKIQGTTSNDSVAWTTSMGTITPKGLYTAPGRAGSGTVTATSVADPTKSASAVVTVTTVAAPVPAPTPGPVSPTPTPPTPTPTSPAVSSVSISPATTSATTGGNISFTATVAGSTTNKSVTWQTSSGNITSGGFYTAPSTPGTSVVTATSVADPTKAAAATITVTAPTPPSPAPAAPTVTSVTVSPGTASSTTGGTLSFKAAVQGTTTNTSVTWTAALGSITSSGGYTAPAKAGTDTVTATSVADTTKSGSATVTVTAPAPAPTVTSVTVSPATASATTGGAVQFSATVQGTTTNTAVTWTAALGTINSSGAYTAPTKAGTDTVTATSTADTTKSGSATVTVTAPAPAAPTPPAPVPSASCGGSGCPAFPGAEGAGAVSAGGRGGVVFEVTNLNDSGTGSLRACVEASGPRTCVFRVSGLITSLSRLQVSNPYLTIAGQTAPGGGIVIGGIGQVGEQLFISTHDVVVRYLTYDGNGGGPPYDTGPDIGSVGFEMASGNIYNVIFDHCTARWWGNKVFPIVSNDAGNVHETTVQWSLMYEPNAAHPVIMEYDATSGSALNSVDNDFHHNMGVNFAHRWVLYDIGSSRMVNNLTYNALQLSSDFLTLSWGGLQGDFIGNKFVDGPQSTEPVHVFLADGNENDPDDPSDNCAGNPCDNPGPPSLYYLNNQAHAGTNTGGPPIAATNTANDAGQISLTAQGSEAGESGDAAAHGAMPSSWYRGSPLSAETFPITPDPVTNLDSVLLPTVGNSQHLDCNGNWVSNRDSQDQRIINQYQTQGSGTMFNGQFSAPAIPGGTACVESLHDGIPDQWKSANGLSTTDPNLNSEVAPNGYTYLENYLNGVN